MMLGLPPGHTSPVAAAAKQKEVDSSRGALQKQRARSAQRRAAHSIGTPASAYNDRAKRFSKLQGLRGVGTPGSTRSSVLQSPELLNASQVSVTSAGQGMGMDVSMDDLLSPGGSIGASSMQSPRRGGGTPGLRSRRAWQTEARQDSVFDARTLDSLLSAPSPARRFRADAAAAACAPAGVAGAARIEADFGLRADDLEAKQASLKLWLAEHISSVFIPTFEANAAALISARENHPQLQLDKEFIQRTGSETVRIPAQPQQQEQVLTLGDIMNQLTHPSMLQQCIRRNLQLTAGETSSSGTLQDWEADYERHNANSLPEAAAHFWLTCAGRNASQVRETSYGASSGGGGGGSVTAKFVVSVWHERQRLEQFFDLLERYSGTAKFERMKAYTLHRLAVLGHSGMSAFQSDEPGDSSQAQAARDSGLGVPSDAFIVLCYFITVMDACMRKAYPGQLTSMANGAIGLVDSSSPGERGQFSACHVAEGRHVAEGISADDHPVLQIVSGAGGGQVHCRMLLNDIAYDPTLDSSSAGRHGAAKPAGESQSLWRTLALLLHVIEKNDKAAARFKNFPAVRRAVAEPALRATTGVNFGSSTKTTYDTFLD